MTDPDPGHRPAQLDEKRGSFYLGKHLDPASGELRDDRLDYDAKDLTTHAVCVGMTGSGKTGLCVSLLEEAALDGIPALVIDPKGDIGNMLLTFPELRTEDFRPWIDEQAAARKGKTPDEFAADRASLWRTGLADWGQSGERIAALRDTVDLSIYTPGSSSGLPLRVLRSFAAPAQAVIDDADTMRERVSSTVAGLLGLLGIDDDPLTSREHMLLSVILDGAWREGRDLDFAALIAEIQTPPFDKVGVLDLESVIPSKDRFKLAMAVNTLLASPTFSAWTQGEPLDIDALLRTPEGKPRVSILSIAHLSESERMFFVTVLLNEVVSWVRSQSGTTSLRGLLFMDEVFGFFPPVAEPPSKKPMLTLLKQARAYGFGVVLATQNPVDLDYKGLSNAGTWFLGRLQTERDLRRVLDGLEGASSAAGSTFDRANVERLLAGLKSRVFLMNNVHDAGPTLFHTRWAMSYLRGPLTRDHIRTLMAPRKAPPITEPITEPTDNAADTAAPNAAAPSAPAHATAPSTASSSRPPVPPGMAQGFMPMIDSPAEGESLEYRPAVLGEASLHYVRVAAKIDDWRDIRTLAPIGQREHATWSAGTCLPSGPDDDVFQFEDDPEPGGTFASLPAWALDAKQEAAWQRELKGAMYRQHALGVWHCKPLKAYSTLGEPREAFIARLKDIATDAADEDVAKLEARYDKKLATLDERIRKAEQRVDVEKAQYSKAKRDGALSLATTLLGGLFGGRKTSGATTARRANSALQQRGDIGRAKENVAALNTQRQSLITERDEAIAAAREDALAEASEVTEIIVRPRKGDLSVKPVKLIWLPFAVAQASPARPLYDTHQGSSGAPSDA